MAIDSYSALQDFVTAHLTLDTTTVAQLPNLIQLAECELDRLLTTPWGEDVSYAYTIAGTQTIALPDSFQQMRTVLLDDDYPLEAVTLNTLYSQYPDSEQGKPQVYAISNGALVFGPIPDAIYTVTATFQAGITPLSDTNTSNWLLAAHPDAYVYATIHQVEIFLVNDERASNANIKLSQIINQINKAAIAYKFSTPMRLQSPVCV